MELNLRKWQKEAFDAWQDNDSKGIIEAATGSGKSFLFLEVIKKSNKKILIVVPTQHLMYQHAELIKQYCNEEVGLVGDGHNELKRVTVAVINSVRESLWNIDILIGDECHRYFSDINRLLFNNNFRDVMLLTATLERQDKKHLKFLEKYPLVYKIGQGECIKNDWLCNYKIRNITIDLNEEEKKDYEEADDYVKLHWYKFKSMGNILRSLYHPVARKLNSAIAKRKNIVCNSVNKIKYTVNLLEVTPDVKTIVFCEFKKTANIIYKVMKTRMKIGLYHSGMKLDKRKIMLEKFKNDEIKIIVAVKALDEGLDVENCERAILLGGTSVKRQFIQRIGRILRASEDKTAEVIQLYIPDSKDEDWLRSRLEGIDESVVKVEWSKNQAVQETLPTL